jgi:hypothetical protein
MKSEADDNIFVAKHFFCGYGLGAGSPNPSNLRGLHFAVLCLRMMSLKNLTLPDTKMITDKHISQGLRFAGG